MSVQHTLFDMGKAALDAAPEIARIHLSMPNLHHLLADLSRLRPGQSQSHLRSHRRAAWYDRGHHRALTQHFASGRQIRDRHNDHRKQRVCAGRRRRKLWPAHRRPRPRGNARPVRFRHGAQHIRVAHYSARLRSRRKRHMVRLSSCHSVHAAGWILHQPLRAPERFARIALHLHRKHAAAGIRRHRRVGIAARISRHRRFGCRRRALLRNRPLRSSSSTGRRLPFPRLRWSALSPDSSPTATSSFPPK